MQDKSKNEPRHRIKKGKSKSDEAVATTPVKMNDENAQQEVPPAKSAKAQKRRDKKDRRKAERLAAVATDSKDDHYISLPSDDDSDSDLDPQTAIYLMMNFAELGGPDDPETQKYMMEMAKKIADQEGLSLPELTEMPEEDEKVGKKRTKHPKDKQADAKDGQKKGKDDEKHKDNVSGKNKPPAKVEKQKPHANGQNAKKTTQKKEKKDNAKDAKGAPKSAKNGAKQATNAGAQGKTK